MRHGCIPRYADDPGEVRGPGRRRFHLVRDQEDPDLGGSCRPMRPAPMTETVGNRLDEEIVRLLEEFFGLEAS